MSKFKRTVYAFMDALAERARLTEEERRVITDPEEAARLGRQVGDILVTRKRVPLKAQSDDLIF